MYKTCVLAVRPGGTLIRNHRFQHHYYQENEKARPGTPAVFTATLAGVLNVPVSAVVSGQLRFPCVPPHRGK